MSKISISIETVICYLIVISSIFPYMNGVYGTALMNLYLLPIFIVIGLLFKKSSGIKSYYNVFGITLFFVHLFTLNMVELVYGSVDGIINFVRYFTIGMLQLMYIAPVFFRRINDISRFLYKLSIVMALLGFLSIFFGSIDLKLISIRKYYDFEFFRIWFPTTSSVVWNTNYFGMMQLLTLPMAMYYYKLQKNKRTTLVGILIICTSIFLSGSRSAIVMMIGYIFLSFLYKIRELTPRKKLLIIPVIDLILFGMIIFHKNVSNAVMGLNNFLIGKGLNGRDELWGASMRALELQPFGYGLGDIGDIMLQMGASTTTPQNAYLQVALRGGSLALISYIFLLLFTVKKYMTKRKNKEVYSVFMWILFMVLVDGFARSYSIGGLGFLSMMFTISIGIMWLPDDFNICS